MILITGGAGFIGRHMTRRLLTEHKRVIVIDTAARPKEFLTSPRLTYIRANALEIERVFRKHRESSLSILHLAAETSVSESVTRPLTSVRSNVELTCAMLEFARKMDVESFVFASSAAVYGERRSPCHELDSPDPGSPYAASKLAGEYYCKVYAKLYGTPATILRYFNVYGPGKPQAPGVIASFLTAVLSGSSPRIFGDGTAARDFIFVDDVVDATWRSMRSKLTPGTVMNIGTGRAVKIATLATKVLKLLERPDLTPVHLPARLGDIGFSQADTSDARRKIGFRANHTIDDGLRLTVRPLGKEE